MKCHGMSLEFHSISYAYFHADCKVKTPSNSPEIWEDLICM